MNNEMSVLDNEMSVLDNERETDANESYIVVHNGLVSD